MSHHLRGITYQESLWYESWCLRTIARNKVVFCMTLHLTGFPSRPEVTKAIRNFTFSPSTKTRIMSDVKYQFYSKQPYSFSEGVSQKLSMLTSLSSCLSLAIPLVTCGRFDGLVGRRRPRAGRGRSLARCCSPASFCSTALKSEWKQKYYKLPLRWTTIYGGGS